MLVKIIKKQRFLQLIAISCALCSVSVARAAKVDSTHVGRGAHYEVVMTTSKGTVRLALYNDTPRHRDNFVKLIKSGFYNQLLFHRVIKEFMIQCGDPASREASAIKVYGNDDAGYKLDAEISPKRYHHKGALAAARESDVANPSRESSSSQFYIVVGKVHNDSTLTVARDRIAKQNGTEITPEREQVYRKEGGSPHLDGSYTIFGEVVSGMGNVEQIARQMTDSRDRPLDDIFIKKINVEVVKDRKRDDF